MPRKEPILACPPVPAAGCGLSHHDIPPSPPVTQLCKSPWSEQTEEVLLSSSNDENASNSFEMEPEEETPEIVLEEEDEDEEEEEEDDEGTLNDYDDFDLFTRQESMLIDDNEDDDDDDLTKADAFLNNLLGEWKYTAPELPTQKTQSPGTPRNASTFPFNITQSEATYNHSLSKNWESHCHQMRLKTETIPLENGIVTVKLLVSEARRLSLQHAQHKIDARKGKVGTCHCISSPIPDDVSDSEYISNLRQVWVQIRQNAIQEVLSEGQHFNTIRRLSNMYLFHEGKQLTAFEMDNPWLLSRMEHQKTVLQKLDDVESEKKLFLPTEATDVPGPLPFSICGRETVAEKAVDAPLIAEGDTEPVPVDVIIKPIVEESNMS